MTAMKVLGEDSAGQRRTEEAHRPPRSEGRGVGSRGKEYFLRSALAPASDFSSSGPRGRRFFPGRAGCETSPLPGGVVSPGRP